MAKLLAALAMPLTLAACAVDDDVGVGRGPEALTASVCPVDTPAAIAPGGDQDLAFTMYATGVQKYACHAAETGAAWMLVAPDALLFDDDGDEVGLHYGGPTWEHADGSLVVGAKRAGVTVDPTAVQWLLLDVVRRGDMTGRMSKVTAIQRLSTTDGLAPMTGCDVDHLGATADVPYTAEYFFYRTRATNPDRNVRCGAD
jgi:hypothetical protein